MYSCVCTLEERCVYSGGRQCGGRWNGGGAVPFVWCSDSTRLLGRASVMSTAEDPTSECDILTVSQSCSIVGGSAVDSGHAV